MARFFGEAFFFAADFLVLGLLAEVFFFGEACFFADFFDVPFCFTPFFGVAFFLAAFLGERFAATFFEGVFLGVAFLVADFLVDRLAAFFLAVFFLIDFRAEAPEEDELPEAPLAGFPKARSQFASYFFEVPTWTIVTVNSSRYQFQKIRTAKADTPRRSSWHTHRRERAHLGWLG